MTGPLLTAREVAELLSMSAETVLRWTRRGELPAFRHRRAVAVPDHRGDRRDQAAGGHADTVFVTAADLVALRQLSDTTDRAILQPDATQPAALAVAGARIVLVPLPASRALICQGDQIIPASAGRSVWTSRATLVPDGHDARPDDHPCRRGDQRLERLLPPPRDMSASNVTRYEVLEVVAIRGEVIEPGATFKDAATDIYSGSPPGRCSSLTVPSRLRSPSRSATAGASLPPVYDPAAIVDGTVSDVLDAAAGDLKRARRLMEAEEARSRPRKSVVEQSTRSSTRRSTTGEPGGRSRGRRRTDVATAPAHRQRAARRGPRAVDAGRGPDDPNFSAPSQPELDAIADSLIEANGSVRPDVRVIHRPTFIDPAASA